MAKQVKDIDQQFETERRAYLCGIEKYGSAGYNGLCGWSVDEVKKQESFGAWSDRNIANRTNEL